MARGEITHVMGDHQIIERVGLRSIGNWLFCAHRAQAVVLAGTSFKKVLIIRVPELLHFSVTQTTAQAWGLWR
jgi:hypothetical protein